MKTCFFTLAVVLLSHILFAQPPQAINYQAVARNSQGLPLLNRNIAIRLSILDGSNSGPSVYSEYHNTVTNNSGLFNLSIGLGSPVSGAFGSISWEQGNMWLKVEMDTTGGNNFQLLGTTQFLSVPYALYAINAKDFTPVRITASQRDAITSPGLSQIIYCTNCGANGGELQVYNGSSWRNMTGDPAAAVLVVGQNYQGGKIGYFFQPGDPGYDPYVPHGLISGPEIGQGKEWCLNGQNIPGADGIAIGTGMLNTTQIGFSCSNNNSAARWCLDLVSGGYSDWFLPSKDELFQISFTVPLSISSPYWTSSEFNNSEAWYVATGGLTGTQGKNQVLWVRAVRIF